MRFLSGEIMQHVVAFLSFGLGVNAVLQAGQQAIALPPPVAQIYTAQANAALQGTWNLVGWGNPETLTPVVADTEITAQFEGDRLNGSTGCNNYVTTYEATEGNLSLSPIASTRRACLPPVSDQETQYLMALSNVDSYAVEGDCLILNYETETMSGVLVFERPTAIPGLW